LNTESVHNRTKIIQKSPISPVLGLLDEYLEKYVGKNHLELYAAFPIYWMYDTDDEEIDDETLREGLGEEMYAMYEQRGSIPTLKANLKKTKSSLKALNGAGALLKVQAPVDKQDADLRDPIGIIPPEIQSLTYNSNELNLLESRIINIATGKIERATKMDRTNKAAVASQFEGERDVLLYISAQLSNARTWVWDTLGKLYFGNKFSKTTYDYGTEFFIEGETQAIAQFESYKKAGASQTLLSHRASIFRDVATKNRPTMQLRMKILEAIEPYPLLDIDQCVALWNQDIMTGLDLDVKVRFSEYVSRFEREEGSITAFNEKMPEYSKWIKTVKDKIYSYGTNGTESRTIN
jgi:hypothetical protein